MFATSDPKDRIARKTSGVDIKQQNDWVRGNQQTPVALCTDDEREGNKGIYTHIYNNILNQRRHKRSGKAGSKEPGKRGLKPEKKKT